MKHDKFPLICVTVVEFEVMLQSDPDLASFDIFSCDFFFTFPIYSQAHTSGDDGYPPG